MTYDYSKKPEPTSYQKQNTPIVEKKLSFFGRVYAFFSGKSKISEAQIFCKANQREQSSEKPTLSELKDKLGDLTDEAARIRGTMQRPQNECKVLEEKIAFTTIEKDDNMKARDSAKDFLSRQKMKRDTHSLELAKTATELNLNALLSPKTTIRMVADKQSKIELATTYLNQWKDRHKAKESEFIKAQASMTPSEIKKATTELVSIETSISTCENTIKETEKDIKSLLKPSESIETFRKAFSQYNKSIEEYEKSQEQLHKSDKSLNQPETRLKNSAINSPGRFTYIVEDSKDRERDFIEADVGVQQKEFEISVLKDKLAEPKRRLDELKTQLDSVERSLAKTNKEIELLKQEPTGQQPSSTYPLSKHQITAQTTHDSLWQWLVSKFQWR